MVTFDFYTKLNKNLIAFVGVREKGLETHLA